jgi:hypothetical protein
VAADVVAWVREVDAGFDRIEAPEQFRRATI